MNIYPYVYRIDYPSGEFYIGYRCANKVPAGQDIGTKYKTSTKHLSYPFEEYSITVVAEFYLPTAKDDAYDFEQALIFEHWGNSFLANKACHYGQARWSSAGIKRIISHDTKTREKMSAAKLGKKRKPFSDETKKRMVEAWKNRKPVSAESRKKMSASQSGKTLSQETKDKLSNRVISDSTRQKLRESRIGKTQSEETKKKISDSLRSIMAEGGCNRSPNPG